MTRQQLLQMETDAGRAGDTLTAAICQIAMNGRPTEATHAALADWEREELHQRFGDTSGWKQAAAEKECADMFFDHDERKACT